MSFLVDNALLILLALTSGAMLLWPALQRRQGGAVSPTEAVMMINREKAVLIDVCEPAEYATAHVAGARNVPLGSLEGSKDLPTNKALPVVLVCASGTRSAKAVSTLKKLGHERAVSLAGGLPAWREANLPIERSKS